MGDTITTISGYNEVLVTSHCQELESLKKDVLIVQKTLNNAYTAIVEKYDSEIYGLIEQGLKQGNFRDALTELVGKPYLNWELTGNKNRYWRMLCAHAYQQYSSRYKRNKMIDLIKENGYESITTEVWDMLREQKLYPSSSELLNIFKSIKNGKERVFKIAQVPLDYTTGDKGTVVQEVNNNKVKVSFQCNRTKMYEVEYTIPDHITQIIKHISKPAFTVLDDGSVQLRYSIETVSMVQSESKNVLGLDLGKIKKFTASRVSDNGEYSQELTPGKELEHNTKKEKRMLKNKNSLYEKKKHIGELIKNQKIVDFSLVDKYQVLDDEYSHVRDKMTRLKDHSSWLVARDSTIHAIEQDCGIIHYEKLSWVSDKDNQGKWDFAVTQQKIDHKAGKFGIRTEEVDPAYTSWEFPEEYEDNPAPIAEYDPKTRELIGKNGDRLDKDYTASIGIACRYPLSQCKGKNKKKKSRKRRVQPVFSRDKNDPTPKRAKKKVLRRFTAREHEIIRDLLDQGCELDGFVLSLSESVATSTGVVVDTQQPVFNEDYAFVHS